MVKLQASIHWYGRGRRFWMPLSKACWRKGWRRAGAELERLEREVSNSALLGKEGEMQRIWSWRKNWHRWSQQKPSPRRRGIKRNETETLIGQSICTENLRKLITQHCYKLFSNKSLFFLQGSRQLRPAKHSLLLVEKHYASKCYVCLKWYINVLYIKVSINLCNIGLLQFSSTVDLLSMTRVNYCTSRL